MAALTPAATSSVTVPVFGFGIRPRGPRTRAILRTSFMASVVAIATSKSIQPPLIFSMSSSTPASMAPAAFASSACVPAAKTMTRTFLPVPFGSVTVPRIDWSDLLRSTPRCIATSTVSSNFAPGLALMKAMASARATGSFGAFLRESVYFLPCLAMVFPLNLRLRCPSSGRCRR